MNPTRTQYIVIFFAAKAQSEMRDRDAGGTGICAGIGPGHTRSARLQRVVPAETHQFRKPQGNLSNLLLHRCEARALKPIETLNIRDRQCSEHLAIGSKIVSDAVSVSRDKVPTLGPKVNGPGLSTCDTTMVRPSLRGGESSAVRRLISWVRAPGTATLLAPGALLFLLFLR